MIAKPDIVVTGEIPTISGLQTKRQLKVIALSPNKKLLMGGGRDNLSIISIGDDLSMTITKNLHSKKSNLNFGAQDIKWNFSTFICLIFLVNQNLVLTSSVNNAINLFDIVTSQQKQSFKEHTKANKVSWNPFDSNVFISGSADTTIKMWDAREPKSLLTFQRLKSTDDQVYSVAFDPKTERQFAAGYGNGYIGVWDLRQPKAPCLSINAHIQKSVLCIDWHPTQKDVLISGSNDRYIKVWNVNDSHNQGTMVHQLKPLFQIQTSQSVKKCQWDPVNPFMISSCSMGNNASDNTVNIWHCKKPYLQQYIFKHQMESVQDFEWLNPKYLITTTGTMLVIEHISTSTRPYQRICAQSLDFNLANNLAVVNDKLFSRDPDIFLEMLEHESSIDLLFGKQKVESKQKIEQKKDEIGNLEIYAMDLGQKQLELDMEQQMYLIASKYEIKVNDSSEVEDICVKNAQAAKDLGFEETSLAWSQLAEIAKELHIINESVDRDLIQLKQSMSNYQYSNKNEVIAIEPTIQPKKYEDNQFSKTVTYDTKIKRQRPQASTNQISHSISENANQEEVEDSKGRKVFENQFITLEMFKEEEPSEEEPLAPLVQQEDSQNANEEEKKEAEKKQAEFQSQLKMNLAPQPSTHQRGNSFHTFFKSTATIRRGTSIDKTQQQQTTTNKSLNQEELNFQVVLGPYPKHQGFIKNQKLNPYHNKQIKHYDKFSSGGISKKKVPQMQKWIQNVVQKTVVDTMSYYADKGDLQTAACMSIVFSKQLNLKTHENFLSRIIISYIELLKDLQMHIQVAKVLKYGPQLPMIVRMYNICQYCNSKDETCQTTICSNPKCNKMLSKCSICNQAVKGLYIWCQGCSHGGHQEHILNWFKENKLCPSGCGHECRE